jgi:hypothetical protein
MKRALFGIVYLGQIFRITKQGMLCAKNKKNQSQNLPIITIKNHCTEDFSEFYHRGHQSSPPYTSTPPLHTPHAQNNPPPPSHPPPHPLRQPHHTGASPEEGTRRETETCVSPTPLPCPPPPPPRAPQGPHPPPSPPPLLQAYPPQREGGRPVGSWTDRGDHFFFPSASRCSQK